MRKFGRVGAVIMFALWATNLEAATSPVFSCSFGASQVTVTSLGGKLVYRFGTRNVDDMTIVQDTRKKNVFHTNEMWARAELQGIRFSNGDYSYLVFNLFAPGSDMGAEHTTARDKSGLAVFKGSKLLSQRTCKTGGDAPDDDALDALPNDPMSAEIIELLKL